MWAQLIRTHLKPGEDIARMTEEIQAAETPGSGLVRSLTMRDQSDPSAMYLLVVFESEEQARAREQDPEREERLKPARQIMSEIFEGPPTFTDLEVLDEWTGPST